MNRAMEKVIERGFGLLKRKDGERPFAEQWAEHIRSEKKLEDRKAEGSVRTPITEKKQ